MLKNLISTGTAAATVAQGSLSRPCGSSGDFTFVEPDGQKKWNGRRVTIRTLKAAGLYCEPCATRATAGGYRFDG
jgi:hypothetical protein